MTRAHDPANRRGYDAAMRVARWRWVLVPMIVVVVGCLPQPTPELPADLLGTLGGNAASFTALPLPAGATGQDVVTNLREEHPPDATFGGRAIVVFGRLDCHSAQACIPGPLGSPGGAQTVWILLFPDCQSPDGSTIGWAVVDATGGVSEGYNYQSCHP